MRNIRIPKFYEEKLSHSVESLLVQQYLSTFDDWYYLNDCVFFREYTDHGTKHITEVLSTAEKLLTKESKENLSSADCALLICSTLLHDFAMHLQEDGFIQLVTSDNPPIGASDFDDKSWRELWKEYVSEIHRLPINELVNLFGSSDPILPPDLSDIDSWKASQYRYIGEFIRRHHPRLAYEITKNGMPGAKGKLPIDQIEESDPNYRLSMLSGIIARSHGMNLRDTFNILNTNYHIRVALSNSHPIYIMILLRISDYVQLQSSRAPNNILKAKRLKSPLSQSEWGLHEAIEGVSFDAEPDPEILKIHIDPNKSDISSYLKTKRLLASIQYELDSSWAVLGEVYGRYPNEDWGITIRRIRSNIENNDDFGRIAGFIPEEVKFTSANTELTKLLIKPLYGDYPEIAVRELVQNSIDACRERAYIEGSYDDKDREKYHVKVELINNPDNSVTLRISDTGVGMTLDVLKNYFLKAGSSFRTSLVWKKQFANDKSKSEVLRTGRFGVGALAAFLIADDPTEIHLSVHSRHVHAEPSQAVSFDTTLSDAPISINYQQKNEIGTIISVTTTSPPSFMRTKEGEEKEGESWDWYCFDWPKVERSLSTGKILPQKYRIPIKPTERLVNNSRLNFINVLGFESVCWFYGAGHQVVCNGIRVIKRDEYQRNLPNLFEEKTISGPLVLEFPNISVMDKDGLLPLTLDRLRLDFNQIPFMRELREDILLSFVIGLSVSAYNSMSEYSFNLEEKKIQRVLKHFGEVDNSSIAWIIENGQISPLSKRSINQLRGKRFIELYSFNDLKFVKSPEEYAIILTKRNICGNIIDNICSKKHFHFLTDRNARNRLEQLVYGREQTNYRSARYTHNFSLSSSKNEKDINEFNSQLASVINIIKHKIKHPTKIINNLTTIGIKDYPQALHEIFYKIYNTLGNHKILERLLFDEFMGKLQYKHLNNQDGRLLYDVVIAITDAEPKLQENQSNDFEPQDCPIDWKEVKKSANENNEDWFIASWVLNENISIENDFIGNSWYSIFGCDFIPLSYAERLSFFDNKINEPIANIHLDRWKKELKDMFNG